MGWFVKMYWFIPRAFLTEVRFATTLKKMAGRAGTRVPVYEPKHPEALTLSTVDFSSELMINGWNMEFAAGFEEAAFTIPQHLGFLEAYWNKLDLAFEPDYAKRFLDTVAEVAEGMGAVFGVYGSDFTFEDVDDFNKLQKVRTSYWFISTSMAERIGRERLSAMGTVKEVSNGLAILLDGPFANDFYEALMGIWGTSGELSGPPTGTSMMPSVPVESKATVPDAIQKEIVSVQSLDHLEKSFLDGEGVAHHYFACIIPGGNHTLERYYSFFNRLRELEDSGRKTGIHQGHTPDVAAEELYGKGSVWGRVNLPTTTPNLNGKALKYNIELVIPNEKDRKRGGYLARDGVLVVIAWVDDLESDDEVTMFITLIETMCRCLEPLYGFGYKNVAETKRHIKSKKKVEDHVWSINFFNPPPGNGSILQAVNRFYVRNVHKWQLRRLSPTMALLLYNDIATINERYISEIDPSFDVFSSEDGKDVTVEGEGR